MMVMANCNNSCTTDQDVRTTTKGLGFREVQQHLFCMAAVRTTEGLCKVCLWTAHKQISIVQ